VRELQNYVCVLPPLENLHLDLASELCQTIGDEYFFTLHIFLKVGKTQDLPSKIW
jgi:hypothetical protein